MSLFSGTSSLAKFPGNSSEKIRPKSLKGYHNRRQYGYTLHLTIRRLLVDRFPCLHQRIPLVAIQFLYRANELALVLVDGRHVLLEILLPFLDTTAGDEQDREERKAAADLLV